MVLGASRNFDEINTYLVGVSMNTITAAAPYAVDVFFFIGGFLSFHQLITKVHSF
jgi:hypothetical protein